jgi:hypothetical protein
MTKEVLKLALEALEEAHHVIEHKQDATKRGQAITAIKEALAQPEQEPVALPDGKRLILVDGTFDDLMYWLDRCERKGHLGRCYDLVEPWVNFDYAPYTPPPQREWVGMTEKNP